MTLLIELCCGKREPPGTLVELENRPTAQFTEHLVKRSRNCVFRNAAAAKRMAAHIANKWALDWAVNLDATVQNQNHPLHPHPMNDMSRQIKPCPNCGKTAGWWAPLDRKSMVFRSATGEKLEHRIFESKAKRCAECDADISKCVST